MLIKNKLPLAFSLTGLIFFSQGGNAQDFFQDNLELKGLESQIDFLKEEKKINHSLFLPELSIQAGLGTEKLKDNNFEADKGPYAYFEGRINLFRGGRDSNEIQKNQIRLSEANLEKEVKLRELKIELASLQTSIEAIDKKNVLILDEIENNKNQKQMANKKVDAGLTTSVDLLDFELKNNLLNNELDKNNLEKTQIQIEIDKISGKNNVQGLLKKEITNEQQLANLSYESSLKIRLAKEKMNLSSIDKSSVKAEYLPSLDLEVKWGQLTPQKTLWKEEKEHSAALNLSIPLFTGFSTNSKIQQSVIETSQRERELRQTQLEQERQFNINKKKVELLKRTLDVLKSSLTQAQRYKDLTIGEYKRGIKNSPDVISASDKKLELEIKVVETEGELFNTIYALTETYKSY